MSYHVTKISENITKIQCDIIAGCWTNSYIVNGNKNSYVIDTGLGKNTSIVMANYMNDKNDVYLINTHYHWDHIWGNFFFENAISICHKKCEINVNNIWDEMVSKNGKYIDGETRKPTFDIVFEGCLSINHEIDLIFTPGHTNDSISVFYKKENTLFVGDLIGDNDAELIPSLKDPNNFVDSLEKCIELKPMLYLSGHNEIKRDGIIEKIKDLYLREIA